MIKARNKINMKLTFFEKLEQYRNSSKKVYINNIYQNENLTYKNLIKK